VLVVALRPQAEWVLQRQARQEQARLVQSQVVVGLVQQQVLGPEPVQVPLPV
jgi:hypothetical protein